MSDTTINRCAEIEITHAGAYSSIQDVGRRGLRRVGVPWSGALHPERQHIANALVSNAPGAAIIEHFDGGLTLRVRSGRALISIAGDAELEIAHDGQFRRAECWRSHVLADGDLLRVRKLLCGRLVTLAIGALQTQTLLASASTCARAGIGRVLESGDVLRADRCTADARRLHDVPKLDTTPIRIVSGPQATHFTPDALDTFTRAEYTVTGQADRMGIRLRGPILTHASVAHQEIISDATLPGSIQVPGNGQPIVLLADAQTAGGYPKIATVISADLGRLADLAPASAVRFCAISVEAAEHAARDHAKRLARRLTTVRPFSEEFDSEVLYTSNLVSGVVMPDNATETRSDIQTDTDTAMNKGPGS